jgi:hypothetical protein
MFIFSNFRASSQPVLCVSQIRGNSKKESFYKAKGNTYCAAVVINFSELIAKVI